MASFDKPPDTRPPGRRIATPAIAPVQSPSESGYVTRAELEAFKRQVLQDVRDELQGMAGGLDARISTVVRTELEKYRDGLERLPKMAEALAELLAAKAETERYRVERSTIERLEKEAAAKEAQRLALAKETAQIEQIGATTANIRVEGGIRYRTILFAFLGVVVTALTGLVGAMLGSRK